MSTALRKRSNVPEDFPRWYIEFQIALLRQAPRPGDIDQVTAEAWTNNSEGLKNNLAECLLPRLIVDHTSGKFVAREKFVVDTSPRALVKISYIGEDFTNWLLPIVEEIIQPQWSQPFVLPKNMYDREIITKLGGVNKIVVSLCEVYAKMATQPYGPKSPGDMRTNGYVNIFYVSQPVTKMSELEFSYRNQKGEIVTEKLTDSQYLFEVNEQWFVLRAVLVRWYDDGWDVTASSVEDSSGWHVGRRVFSRNSELKNSESSGSE